MIGTSLHESNRGGAIHSSKLHSILSRSRPSVRCRRTDIQKILLQSSADNDEKASFVQPNASIVMPALNAIRQRFL